MLKLFHISDIHLGKRLYNYDLSEEHKYALAQIVARAKKLSPDCILISGDIYDRTAPSEASIAILNRFLSDLHELKIPICIISGNHDPDERLSFLKTIVAKQSIYFSSPYKGEVERVKIKSANIYLLPYIRTIDVKKCFPDEDIKDIEGAVNFILSRVELNKDEINIILSHQYVVGATLSGSEEMNIGGEAPISTKQYEAFDYVALGHIHSSQKVNLDKLRYSGSIVKCSIKEKEKRSFLYVEISDDKSLRVEKVYLEPLHDIMIKRGYFDDIIKESSNDYVYVILKDNEIIPDGAKRLSDRFPFFLSLEYESSSTSDEYSHLTPDNEYTPLEYFEELFSYTLNKELSDEQRTLAKKLIDDIWSNI